MFGAYPNEFVSDTELPCFLLVMCICVNSNRKQCLKSLLVALHAFGRDMKVKIIINNLQHLMTYTEYRNECRKR